MPITTITLTGQECRDRRKEHDLTQVQLADLLGYSQGYVTQQEARARVSARFQARVEATLGFSAADLAAAELAAA